MIIYIILLLLWGSLSLVLSQSPNYRTRFNRKVYIVIAGTSLFIVMGLRHISVGTDLISYYYEYLNSELYLGLRPTERGYSYFNHLFSSLGFSFQLYLLIISGIIVAILSKIYLKYSRNIMLSFYLYVTLGMFAMTMTGLRQSIAVMITVLAFIHLMKKRRLLFFILVWFATLFHNSAIIFIVVYFIKNIKLTKTKGHILYILALLTYFIKDILINLVIYISPDKYLNRYLTLDSEVNPLIILVYIAIPIAVLLVWNQASMSEKLKESTSIMFVMSLINIVLYFISIDIPMVTRLTYYFMIYNTILIPNVIGSIKSREIRFIAIVASIILPLIMFLLSTPGGSLGIDNYKFFWE